MGWLLVSVGAFGLVRIYFYDGLIGAGDSYHYALQVADFVTQLRHGVFPVLIGQSEYAFNGNVHTVRTAPYLTYLAGMLDLFTGQKISFYLLKNLTVILSAWGGAFAAYLSVRWLAPGRKIEAVLIALTYISAPGILTPLMSLDMYATFMTVPFLPLFFLGLALSLQRVFDGKALILSVVSLALIWYGHPPIATWLSPLLIVTQAVRIVLAGAAPGNWWRPLAGAGLFIVLTSYVFFSVYSLHFPSTEERANATRAGIAANLAASAPSTFLPIGDTAEQQLQLGYPLWACLGICLVGLRRAKLERVFLALSVLAGLALVLPVPRITGWLWSIIPAAVVNLTNNWPGQRFYPLLSAAILVWTALSLGGRRTESVARRRLLTGFLSLTCFASLLQAGRLIAYGKKMTVPKDLAAGWIDPENLTLTRSSYLLFNGRPGYYSDSWVDPEFESRLLDSELNPLLSDSDFLLRSHANDRTPPLDLGLSSGKILELDRGKNWLLVFNFPTSLASGEIVLTGPVRRVYYLPLSGEALAFGSGPRAAHTLNLRAKPGAPSLLTVLSTVPGVSVSSFAFDAQELPIRVTSFSPYLAQVRATQPGFLETPAVFVPGYAAKVNGQTQILRRSYQGLVTIPIPAGKSEVELSYPGPPGLRATWFLALLGFISVPFFWRTAKGRENPALDAAAIRRYNLFTLPRHYRPSKLWLTVSAVVMAASICLGVQKIQASREKEKAFGSIRLAMRLPQWSSKHAEPLVLTGHQGAADCIYLVYEDPTHARVGFDHWGKGGPISAPFPIQRGPTQTVEITMASLYPKGNLGWRTLSDHPSARIPVMVSYNGTEVLREALEVHPAAPSELAIGLNSAGTSTCDASFTGEIFRTERFIPDFLKNL